MSSTQLGAGLSSLGLLRTSSLRSVPRAALTVLAIAGTYALPFSIYQFYLAVNVSNERVKADQMFGDKSGDVKEAATNSGQDPLLLAVRAHGNFMEHVPLAFVLATIAELNGASKKSLNIVLATLFVARVAHVELGLRGNDKGAALGRPLGALTTQGVIVGLAGWSVYLVKDYWGF